LDGNGHPESSAGFYVLVKCRHSQQASAAVRILSALEPVLIVVDELILYHFEYDIRSSEWYNKVKRTQWRELLRPFSNVKILHVQNECVEELARSLHSVDEEMPVDILSNLKELRFSGGGKNGGDSFTPFIEERQAAGHPVEWMVVQNFRIIGGCEEGNVNGATVGA
jgi:hypothetical protein